MSKSVSSFLYIPLPYNKKLKYRYRHTWRSDRVDKLTIWLNNWSTWSNWLDFSDSELFGREYFQTK